MKRMIHLIAITAALVTPALAQPVRYSIQPLSESRLELHVFKTGLYRGKMHTFLLPSYSGTLTYDEEAPAASRVELTMAAGALKCVDTWLSSKDLKNVQEYALKDVLAADKYPEIRFTSSEIRPVGPSHFEVQGSLVIRGVAKPSVLDVTLQQNSAESLTVRGTATIRLTDYGLKPPKALLGTIGTKNEMEFSFNVRADRM